MSSSDFIQALQATLGDAYRIEPVRRSSVPSGYVAFRVRLSRLGVLHVFDAEVRADVVDRPASVDLRDLAERIRWAGSNLERYTVRVVRYPGPPMR